MSSTVLIVQQLAERAELNRTHGRLAFSVVLFQDIAVVPFLALAAALAPGTDAFNVAGIVSLLGAGIALVLVVLAAGRWLLRPLLYVIANSHLRELFTLAVLLVALTAAWASQLAGFSMALGAFLAGMMLAETEYSHQVESVIRPFRDILLGLFFISVGMLLDFNALWREFGLILALVVALVCVKTVVAAAATRLFVDSTFKAVRTGLTLAVGGEFGIALLTLMLQNRAIDPSIAQPLLVAVVRRHGAGARHPRQQQARRARCCWANAVRRRPPSSARMPSPWRSPSASTSSCAASAAWARTWRACSKRRASNTSPSISIRCACAPRGRSASRWCTAIPPTSRCSRKSVSPTPMRW